MNKRAQTPTKKRAGRTARPGPDKALRDKVRAAFTEAGITITAWAKANQLDRQTVVDVLHGRRAGHHGEAHRVAVMLGLKSGRVLKDVALFNPAANTATKAA